MASSNVQHAEAKPATFDAAVLGATVQLPAFDKVEPETWFAVADANFALRKVTDEVLLRALQAGRRIFEKTFGLLKGTEEPGSLSGCQEEALPHE